MYACLAYVLLATHAVSYGVLNNSNKNFAWESPSCLETAVNYLRSSCYLWLDFKLPCHRLDFLILREEKQIERKFRGTTEHCSFTLKKWNRFRLDVKPQDTYHITWYKCVINQVQGRYREDISSTSKQYESRSKRHVQIPTRTYIHQVPPPQYM